ncbi:MAG: hypothetical protein M5T61_18935 [Acidimicrobiia bacterium]|nr:hypothetical protein [Acidimicrobiia bacterium]
MATAASRRLRGRGGAWLRVVDGRVDIEGSQARGFSDEFERQGVPAMRDMLTMMFSVFDGTVPMSPAGALNAAPVEVRERALRSMGGDGANAQRHRS